MKLTPLTRRSFLIMLMLLAGCSSSSDLPDFTASGYLADGGAVRIWRKNSHQQISRLMTVYTPFNGAATETSDYLWQDEKLVSVERHVSGDRPDDVTLHFDYDGNLSFMQRQLAGRREVVSADAVALYQFDAQKMLKISDDLLAGRVLLRQGTWQGSGVVAGCRGGQLKPEFDKMELRRIARQQPDVPGPVSIAWLEEPGDSQLLLISGEDLCKSEPQEADF